MLQIFNIVKKELDKIFKSRRLFFSTFILPGLLIFLIYSSMGSLMENEMGRINQEELHVQVQNAPESFKQLIDQIIESEQDITDNSQKLNIVWSYQAFDDDQEALRTKITNQEKNAYLSFAPDFESAMEAYLLDSNNPLPVVSIYGVQTNSLSSAATTKLTILLNMYNEQLLVASNQKPILFASNRVELASEEDLASVTASMLLPMFIMIFLFATGMAIGADAIAGEKERGTIATLLIAPISKNKIVIGKICSTIIITLLAGIGSFVGTILGLNNAESLFGEGMTFSAGLIFQLLFIILAIALLASSLFLIASTLAKSIKEATTFSMPFYFIALILGIIPTVSMEVNTTWYNLLIPIYNLVIASKACLQGQLATVQFFMVIGSTVLYSSIIIVIITQLFKSEKIMFQK